MLLLHNSLFMFHVFCEFIPSRGPCAPHYGLKLNRDIKYLCSKQSLWFDPYSCLTITDKLLGFGGTLILKSGLLPSNLFCQLGAIATSVCQGTDFQTTLHVCLWLVFLLLFPPPFVLPLVLQHCTVWLRVYIPLEYSGALSHLIQTVRGIIHTDTQYTQRSGSNVHILTFLCTHRQHAHSSNFR